MNSAFDPLPSLHTQYRIDRELNGGGMSRVFVAEELALGRLVVIKLLPPEMAAAVSVERFRREIQLVAGLQHPHIVPVLSAGSADEQLYYIMPFVDGLSLRDRLSRDGALPIDDAVSIVREVAGALSYAHGRGLVHRDIKPENVLLSQGHALVTDFGIAKALDKAPATGTGEAESGTGGMLTGVGTSIGTPAYMSPEQGVGDPSTDSRSDIYSLGVLAYELFAGATPFAERTTTHALLTAHIIETPVRLVEKRPDVPDAVAAVIMRCLAKKPEDRPAHADEIVRVLSAGRLASRAHTPSGKRARTLWLSLATTAVVGLTAAALAWQTFGPDAVRAIRGTAGGAPVADRNDNDRVTVTTFANETGDTSLDGIGRMTADWLTTSLAGTGLVKVVDARAALGAAGASSDVPSAIKTARELGAGTVVTGSYYKIGDSLQFDMKLLDANTAEVVQLLGSVKGPASNPTATIELARQRTLGALATRFNPQLGALARTMSQPPSYAAYQQLVAGIDAFFEGKLADAKGRFIRAATLDTGSVQARTWLLETLEATGELHAADSVAEGLEKRRERLSPFENAQLDEYTSSIRRQPAANVAATFRMHALAPNGQYRATLARKLLLANRWREGLDTLDAAPAEVGLFKGKPFPLEQRRQLTHRLELHDKELQTVRELQGRFPSPAHLLDEARALAAAGNIAALPMLVGKIVAQAGAQTSARSITRVLADELRAHGHEADAERMLVSLLASYDGMPADSARSAPAARGRAETLARLGRWNEAYTLIKPYVSTDTTLATRLAFAVAAAHAGNPSLAERLDRELVKLPDDPYRAGDVQFLRARLAMARGDRAGTIVLLRAAQERSYPIYDAIHANFEFEALRNERGLFDAH